MSDAAASVSAGLDAPALSHGDWADLAPHPVRRWVARQFDSYITTGLVLLAIAGPLVLLLPKEQRLIPGLLAGLIYLLTPVRGFLTAVLNAALLRATSTTPGKWLCGVRIVRRDGARMGFGRWMSREMEAFAVGCGLYIPLVAQVCWIVNFNRLRDAGLTPWDEGQELIAVQRPNSPKQLALTVLAFLPVLVVAIAIAVLVNIFEAQVVPAK